MRTFVIYCMISLPQYFLMVMPFIYKRLLANSISLSKAIFRSVQNFTMQRRKFGKNNANQGMKLIIHLAFCNLYTVPLSVSKVLEKK